MGGVREGAKRGGGVSAEYQKKREGREGGAASDGYDAGPPFLMEGTEEYLLLLENGKAVKVFSKFFKLEKIDGNRRWTLRVKFIFHLVAHLIF